MGQHGAYPRFISSRREELGLGPRDLAAGIGVANVTVLSNWIAGRRPLPNTPAPRRRYGPLDLLDRTVAIGERNGARHPVYVLGIVGSSGKWAQVEAEGKRIAYFDWSGRDLARDTAEKLCALGWADLAAVPAWPSWLEAKRAEGREPVWLDREVHEGGSGRSEKDRAAVASMTILEFVASALRQGDVNAGIVRDAARVT